LYNNKTSFNAHISQATKTLIKNKDFLSKLESKVKESKVLSQFSEKNDTVSLGSVSFAEFGNNACFPVLILTSTLCGMEVNACLPLKNIYCAVDKKSAYGESLVDEISSDSMLQLQILQSIDNADLRQLKSAMAQDFIRQYSQQFEDEEYASRMFDNLKIVQSHLF